MDDLTAAVLRATKQTGATSDNRHKGRYVWKNPAELVWECDTDCTDVTCVELPDSGSYQRPEGGPS
jgi:hypothetical protein